METPLGKFTLGYTGVDSLPRGMSRHEYVDCIVCGESHFVGENDRGYKELSDGAAFALPHE
jgi:hypothetical protein